MQKACNCILKTKALMQIISNLNEICKGYHTEYVVSSCQHTNVHMRHLYAI